MLLHWQLFSFFWAQLLPVITGKAADIRAADTLAADTTIPVLAAAGILGITLAEEIFMVNILAAGMAIFVADIPLAILAIGLDGATVIMVIMAIGPVTGFGNGIHITDG